MSDDLVVQRRWPVPGGVVAEVTLNRPEARNAVSTALAHALTQACTGIAGDRSVRAVVVASSHPTAFCAGADLKERASLREDELWRHRDVTRAAYRSVLDLPMPAIAAVEGHALGGGCEIALCCDIVVAGAGATFGLPEVSVGTVPGGGGTQLLQRRVGWSRAARAIFTAERYDAARAERVGIVDELVPAGSALERARALAVRIAANSPVAVREAKQAMRRGAGIDLASALDVEDAHWRATAGSPDRVEGLRAFVEKRAPVWRNHLTEQQD